LIERVLQLSESGLEGEVMGYGVDEITGHRLPWSLFAIVRGWEGVLPLRLLFFLAVGGWLVMLLLDGRIRVIG
jgi:hypothetical protein